MLLIVLWVRSYWRFDLCHARTTGASFVFTVFRGQVGISGVGPPLAVLTDLREIEIKSNPIKSGTQVNYNLPSYLGFKSSWLSPPVGTPGWVSVMPLWFPTVVFGIAAAILWVKSFQWRFRLRTLLIAVTLLAMVLGAAIYATR